MKKILVLAMALLMAVTLLVACAAPAPTPAAPVEPAAPVAPAEPATPAEPVPAVEPAAPEAPAEIAAGVSLYYRRDEWYKDLENSFLMSAADQGVKIDVQDADTDPAKQAQQLEDFVTKKFNAVAFAPAAPDALVPVAKAATDKGVAVFIFDGYMDEPFVTGNVIFDFALCGKDLGKAVIDWCDANMKDVESIKVAIIDLPISTQVGVPIINNFKDTIAANGRFEVVAQQDGKADRNVAMGVMENILTAQKNKVDIIIGNNYDACMGGLTAVDSKGLTGKVAGFAPFWGEEAFKKLEANAPGFKGGISYSPLILGQETVKAIKQHFNGGLPQRDVVAPSMLLTADTIKDFDWRAVIALRK